MLMDPQFWVALLEIIGVNIILSGDNAVVIALACRSLPPRQQKIGILLGSGAAVAMRVVFTIFIAYLLTVPYLKIVGGLLLFWIGYKLMQPEDEGHGDVDAAGNLMGAVRTVLIADAVMSLDNVIAVAAAAKGSHLLLILGLAISVPLVVYGATLMLKLIQRYPIIVTLGAALIGYIAGEVVITDPIWDHWIETHAHWLHYAAPIAGGVLVVVIGMMMMPPAAAPASDAEAVAAPLAVFGARLGLHVVGRLLMTRSPLIVTFIASMLGYTGGQVAMGEPHLSGWADSHLPLLHTAGPILAAAIAVAVAELASRWLKRRSGPAAHPAATSSNEVRRT